MPKRQFDETDGSAASPSPKTDSDGSATKKRKVQHDLKAPNPNGDKSVTKLSKEERRERKRLKKLRNKNSSVEVAVNGEIETGTELGEVDTKAARRAEKARLKILRKAEAGRNGNGNGGEEAVVTKHNGSISTNTELSGIDVEKDKDGNESAKVNQSDKTARKEARKAEKAGLKQAVKHARNGKGVVTQVATTTLDHPASLPTSAPPSGYHEDSALTATPQSEVDSFLSSNFITITDPEAPSQTLRPIISFSHLPASARTETSSLFASFKTPTPIQSAAWPFLLSGRDVIGVAETGSGKTLAFGVPCIRHISSLPPLQTETKKASPPARAVIVSPTRELAVQIYEQMLQLTKPAGLQAVCVYGGVPKDAQRLALKSAHIIVATPGRLNDLINEGFADLSRVSYLVLDEADRMLDKGFEEEIRKIISATPSPSPQPQSTTDSGPGRGRQTLMFTATWPPSVRDLASTFMHSPVKIAIGDNPTGELRANTRIVQKVEVVDPRTKEPRLLQLIRQYQSGKAKDDRILVFCLYKKEATRVENFLRSKGLRVAGIHGDLSQEKRTSSLEAFKRHGGTPVLVATDVAARGLDIPAVKVVINVTFPLTVEDYVHRIGR